MHNLITFRRLRAETVIFSLLLTEMGGDEYTVTAKDFEKRVLRETVPIMVDFHARYWMTGIIIM